MFDNLISNIKEWFKRMFSANDIKKVINQDVSISDDMLNAITEWYNMYCGNGDHVNHDLGIYSLHLEQAICKEFADVSVSEMTVEITNPKLDIAFKQATKDINEKIQLGLALGSIIIKPLGENKVEFITADSFIPVQFDAMGRLIKVLFIETRKISSTSYYRRFEYHSLGSDGLTITNKAYHSSNKSDLGQSVPLAAVQDWENYVTDIRYPLVDKPIFGYYRNPIPNTIDGSQCGQSIYESAKYLIKQADIQYGLLNWEFESGQRAVDIDISALKHETLADGTSQYRVDKLRNRLYRGHNLETGADGKGLYQVFSPEFRDASILNGLQEYKRAIELSVGLSYGDISNAESVDKTATEIKASKKRKYNSVNQIQSNLKDCLEDLAYGLAFFNKSTTNYEFVCSFSDSILTDEETERKQDMADVSGGIMNDWEYRAKWYNETDEQAKANVPAAKGVMGDDVTI